MLVKNVREVAPERQVREKVLPVSVALDKDGQPTAPLAKKLAALGFPDFPLSDLERAQDGKAEAFFLRYAAPGATLADGLQSALDETLAKLPIPKVMTYQRPDGTNVQFVRPVQRLVALHGRDVVPATALGIDSGDTTIGHRFMSHGFVQIAHADDYADTLRSKAHVVASFDDRKESIRTQLQAFAGNDRVVMPEALLDEVNALVEWPVVYQCHFGEEFLQVPQECLILTMQTNQKYFALTDANGRLRSRFLIVSNIDTKTPADIVEGNERVVRPRLADAKFFFEQDKKKRLADRVPLLANVVYHNKLGSQLQRVQRVEALAGEIAPMVGVDVALTKRAALLAKADLLTDMVGEFPELQGTMGTYYARHDGEPEEVALACSEHYQPRFSGDETPSTGVGVRGRARGQAGDDRRHLGHRPATDRRKRPVRAASPCARRAADPARKAARDRSARPAARRAKAICGHAASRRIDGSDSRVLYRPLARRAARTRLQRKRNRRGAEPEPDASRRHRRAPRSGARIRDAGGSVIARGGQQAHLEHPEEVVGGTCRRA